MRVHAEPPPSVVYDPTGLQYQTEKQLGRGGFAICWQALQTDNGRLPSKTVALKIVQSQMEPKKLAQKFVTELQLHSKLHRHPNIVEFYRAFSFGSSTYVVLEVCPNGSLADCLKKRSYLSMPEIRRYTIQTCGAVKYLHTRNIVHRDLKTGNLFLDQEMNVKVGDFGLAAVLIGPHDAAMRRTTMCGTPSYIAPEVLEKSGKGHNEKVDIWAVGIIAYTLAVGKAPFHASKPAEIMNKVAKGEYAWPDLEQHENVIPDDLRKLVSQILVDENSRPSLDTIVSHPFFKLGYLPETLGKDAITSMPEWTIKPPSPATIKQGYSECWYKQCTASGVGEHAPGKFFSAVEDSSSCSSIYRECEREAEAGKMPVVPMPNGTVYVPFVSKKGKRYTGGLEKSDKRPVSATSSHPIESPINTNHDIPDAVKTLSSKQRGAKVRDTLPSVRIREIPPASSHAETTSPAKRSCKDTSNPSTEPAARRPFGGARPRSKLKLVSDEPEAEAIAIQIMIEPRQIRPPRVQPTLPASRSTSRDMSESQAGTFEPLKSIQTTSHNTVRAQAGRLAPVRSIRNASHGAAEAEAATLATSATVEEPSTRVAKSLPKPVVPTSPSIEVAASWSRKLTNPNGLPLNIYADPDTFLARAEELRHNVTAALASVRNAPDTLHEWNPPTEPLPFVSQWVDYSRKYGIGYILTDGSVGIITNHTDDKPLMHTVVGHGYEYLKTSQGHPTLETMPFKFFAQADNGSLKEGTLSKANRKQHSILWAKFGQYMCNHLNDQASIRTRTHEERPVIIVRYYQRVSGVGIWGFSNGCYQFNFPDHTKIVLSADGRYISLTALPLSATKHVATNSTELPSEFIRARKVVSGTTYELLYDMCPILDLNCKFSAEITADGLALATANALPAKLRFAAYVVDCWISGGGLGWKPMRRKWPGWGIRTSEEDLRGSKIDCVTLGRFGGDGPSRANLESRKKAGDERVENQAAMMPVC